MKAHRMATMAVAEVAAEAVMVTVVAAVETVASNDHYYQAHVNIHRQTRAIQTNSIHVTR